MARRPKALPSVPDFTALRRKLATGNFSFSADPHGFDPPCAIKQKSTPSLRMRCFLFGGDGGDRTLDLLNAIQALSQLSYAPERLYSNITQIKKQEFFKNKAPFKGACVMLLDIDFFRFGVYIYLKPNRFHRKDK